MLQLLLLLLPLSSLLLLLEPYQSTHSQLY
jgi:hypothetical protein